MREELGIDELDEPQIGFTRDDADAIGTALTNGGLWEHCTAPVQLATCKWNPDLAKDDRICHIHLTESLPNHLEKRIRESRSVMSSVSVAAPRSIWSRESIVNAFAPLDVSPIILDPTSDGWRYQAYGTVAQMIGKERFILRQEQLKSLLNDIHSRALQATTNDSKGKLFEQCLVMLFSQVDGFEFFESRYINDTEEIDIVLRSRRLSGSAWPESNVVIVSAKNTKKPVGVPELKALKSSMNDKRGQANLGFLCSARKIASKTINKQLLRYSERGPILVPIDGDILGEFIASSQDVTSFIEDLVMQATLI